VFVNADRSFYTNEILRFRRFGQRRRSARMEKLTISELITVEKKIATRALSSKPNAPIFEELRGILLKTVGLADVLRLALLPAIR